MNRILSLATGAFIALSSADSFAEDRAQNIFEEVCPDWKQMTAANDKDIKKSLQDYNDMLQMFIDELPTEARIYTERIAEKIHGHCSAVAALPAEDRTSLAPDIEKMNALFEELLRRRDEYSHPEETPFARDRKK